MVKECYSVHGMPTTAGTPELRSHVAETDAVVVQRLGRAGAIIYGKTNTPGLANDLQTYNDLFRRHIKPMESRPDAGRVERRVRGRGRGRG